MSVAKTLQAERAASALRGRTAVPSRAKTRRTAKEGVVALQKMVHRQRGGTSKLKKGK
jgi:translation elongation factor EF-Ts